VTQHRERLSVLMPTFQGQQFIGHALESIAHYRVPDMEVILIDDGSTDQTIEIAKAYRPRLHMRILQPDPRHNWIAMTNIGLVEATGAWSCILHQDDAWHPDRVSSLTPMLPHHSSSMICFQTELMDEAGRYIGMWRFPRAVRQYLDKSARMPLAKSLYVQNWLAVPSIVFDTTLARKIGGLDETLWYTADWDLWLKLLQQAPATLLGSTGAYFRIHSQSQTTLRSNDAEAFLKQMEVVQERHLWALESEPRAHAYHSAGVLSTRTNSALAATFHLRPGGYLVWLRSLVTSGFPGTVIWITNSAILDRIVPRLRLILRRRFRRGVPRLRSTPNDEE